MQIRLRDIAKRYHHWIFRRVNYSFDGPATYGITGCNGSGKSTLLGIISGYTTPTEGMVVYNNGGQTLPGDQMYQMLTIATPYNALIGELTVEEHLAFHLKFKVLINEMSIEEFLARSQLTAHRSKLVSHLSSGLLQRFKLSLALLTDTPVLLLDEPTSYLDASSREWFSTLFQDCCTERLVILASNDSNDLQLAKAFLDIESFAE